jgi:hypothetical protein
MHRHTLSHLLHSSSQLLTREVGHTISARFMVGVPSVPWLSSVHSSEMPCRQGLTLVHFWAQRRHILWDTSGD